jgi:putative ABC transport system permease protein
VLGLVLAEAVLLIVLGGVLGLLLAQVLLPAVNAGSGGRANFPPIGGATWALGLALMLGIGLVVGFLPALRGMRLRIVDALAGR